jgi:D-xylose transport system permease protein
MTDTPHTPDVSEPTRLKRTFFQTLEIDTRLLGMIAAFLVIALIFNVLTEGRFLTPRNVFNLTIQFRARNSKLK